MKGFKITFKGFPKKTKKIPQAVRKEYPEGSITYRKKYPKLGMD